MRQSKSLFRSKVLFLQFMLLISCQFPVNGFAAMVESKTEYSMPAAGSLTESGRYQDVKNMLSDSGGVNPLINTANRIMSAMGMGGPRTLYVSVNGNDSGDGSQEHAWKSLRYAVSQLMAGDTLMLMAGTYTETVDFKVSGTENQWITIQGMTGAVINNSAYSYDPAFDTKGHSFLQFKNLKVINSRAAVWVNAGSHDINIDGLTADHDQFAVLMTDAYNVTVTNATADNSRNAFRGEGNTHHVTFDNVKAFNSKDIYTGYDLNYLNGDGFIFEADTHDLSFTNITSANHWDSGFDIKGSNVLIQNATVYGNKNGLKLWGDNIHVINLLSYANKKQKTTTGGYVDGNGVNLRRGTSYFTNCTFVDNDDNDFKVGTSQVVTTLENSIVARRTSSGRLLGQYGNSQSFTQKNVLWYRLGATTPDVPLKPGSFWADPGFMDWSAKDYRLRTGSSAINKGLVGTLTPETDIMGKTRVVNHVLDLGAYEYQAHPYLAGITADEKTKGKIFVSLNEEWAPQAVSAHYLIDGKAIGAYTVPPFTMGGTSGYDTKKLKNGTHTITGYLTLPDGSTVQYTVKFVVKN